VEKRKCANPACRRLFVVDLKNSTQRYCSRKECQRMRKTKWQRKKMANDEDYRKNQADAQKRWTMKQKQYWKEYRAANSEYEKRNRNKQKERDRSKREVRSSVSISDGLAKMDALNNESAIMTGVYQLIPFNGDNLAKMDALTVKITKISIGCEQV